MKTTTLANVMKDKIEAVCKDLEENPFGEESHDIHCPRCQVPVDLWAQVSTENWSWGGRVQVQCVECDKPYEVSIHIKRTFDTRKT